MCSSIHLYIYSPSQPLTFYSFSPPSQTLRLNYTVHTVPAKKLAKDIVTTVFVPG